MSATTTKIETLTLPAAQPKRRPGRPTVYTEAERIERARAATKRSQQRRINRKAADLDAAAEALTSINIARLSKEDKERVANALQGIANVRAEYTVKEVDTPDTEWSEAETAPETTEAVAE